MEFEIFGLFVSGQFIWNAIYKKFLNLLPVLVYLKMCADIYCVFDEASKYVW